MSATGMSAIVVMVGEVPSVINVTKECLVIVRAFKERKGKNQITESEFKSLFPKKDRAGKSITERHPHSFAPAAPVQVLTGDAVAV